MMETKKQKTKKRLSWKRLDSEDYKNCLEAAQIENKINHSEKNKTGVDSLKEDQKEFMKNNKLILKTRQRFKESTAQYLYWRNWQDCFKF